MRKWSGWVAQGQCRADMKPHYKLVARVTTARFRQMVYDGLLRSTGWRRDYRRPGNTIAIDHDTAHIALFGQADDIYLCAPTGFRIRRTYSGDGA